MLPLSAGVIALAVLFATAGTHKPLAIAMFASGAFVIAAVAQEFVRGTRARRALAREPVPLALLALVRRNRRRYGGYIVHVGIAVLFIGVAASSSFQHVVEAGLSPGQSERVGAYTVRYVRPTATVSPANDVAHTGSTLSLGAVLDVKRNGRHVATLSPSQGYYAAAEPSLARLGRRAARRPGRQSRELERGHHSRRLERDRARPRRTLAAAHHRNREPHAAAPGRRGRARLSSGSAYLAHPPLIGAVPPDRLAARDVDLDRRADRLRRRARSRCGRPRARSAGTCAPPSRARVAEGLVRALIA